jgi:apolipoprotein N-acyltransferase
MSIWFPPWQYVLRGLAFLGLVGLAIWGARGRPLSLTVAMALVFGVILAALNFSWSYDFQPQGRYVFAIVPIVALTWTHDDRPPMLPAWALLFAAFFLGYQSMLTLGIPELLGAHVMR